MHLQREALQQRQAELHSVDQRILELQDRLSRKKTSNLVLLRHQHENDMNAGPGNAYNVNSGGSFLMNRLNVKSPPNILQKNILRAYVEPYNHVPNKIVQQVANELTLLKLQQNQMNQNSSAPQCESDEVKLARQQFDTNHNDETSNVQTRDMMNEIKRNLHFEMKGEQNDQRLEQEKLEAEKLNAMEKENRILHFQQLQEQQSSNIGYNKQQIARTDSDTTLTDDRAHAKNKMLHFIPSGNLVAPPRKPISSVTPTSIATNTLPSASITPFTTKIEAEKSRPALPPKPLKSSNSENDNLAMHKKDELPQAEIPQAKNTLAGVDNLPIKAKPLTIKKQPLSEQPKLKASHHANKFIQSLQKQPNSNATTSLQELKSKLEKPPVLDETDRACSTPKEDITSDEETIKRKKSQSNETTKTKLARRVSFDPLALLLDASLEGELELVRKTAVQVSYILSVL